MTEDRTRKGRGAEGVPVLPGMTATVRCCIANSIMCAPGAAMVTTGGAWARQPLDDSRPNTRKRGTCIWFG